MNQKKMETDSYEYIKEYLYVLALGIVFCCFVSIMTYDPTDPSTFHRVSTAQQKISNYFGPLGATVSDWMFQLFGIGAIVFPGVFLFQLLNTFRRPRLKSRFYLRVFGYPQFIIFYLALVSGLKPFLHFRGIYIDTGGIIGKLSFDFIASVIGYAGSILALSIGVISSLTLCLGVRPLTTIMWVLNLLPFVRPKKFVYEVAEEVVPEESPLFSQENTKNVHHHLQDAPAVHTQQNLQIACTTPFTHEVFLDLVATLESYQGLISQNDLNLEQERLQNEANLIEEKLETFGVSGKILHSRLGPVVNIHEFEPASGVKISKVFALQDDLTMALSAQSISMSMQVGKNTLTIEVPNATRETVFLREIMESEAFNYTEKMLPLALGKKVDGSPLVLDLADMPHLLVAGATGSGKSMCLNVMLLSLMMSKSPQDLRFILIDPKMLELSHYDGIGHLLMPVVTTATKASAALNWAFDEMQRRYLMMKNAKVRNIAGFNERIAGGQAEGQKYETLPYIVIVIDELSDLMMNSAADIESSIQRLAQKARAAGIHLILATQRPSVDVITGVIKASFPSRLSFQVASRHDSRTIIENIGAERLLGKGDMLFLSPGMNRTLRAQCAFMTDIEMTAVSDKLRGLYPTLYERDIIKDIERMVLGLKDKNDVMNDEELKYSKKAPNREEYIEE